MTSVGKGNITSSTSSPVELSDLNTGSNNIENSSRYEAVNYFVLEAMLKRIRQLTPATIFTDLGCGKGRAMVVAAYSGFTQINGVDFAKEVCEMAVENMQITSQYISGMSFRVVCSNVLDYEISPDESVFFMFNPFAEETIRKFLRKIEYSMRINPRSIYFLYVSPKFIETFFDFNYDPVYRIRKLKYLEGVILKKDPEVNKSFPVES